uniref:Uncharacterized protein n=1 Tax=Lotus japonicus TaxID=34305 RepID=I3SZR9_LOTJA|nr:unknown [Lotus japonicus]
MRRRPVAGLLPDQMEKSTAKYHNSRICFLASLSAFFWFLLLYFHFVVLATDHQSTTLNQNPTVNFQSQSQSQNQQQIEQPQQEIEQPQQQKKQEQTRKSIGFPDLKEEQESPEEKIFPFTRALRTAENKSDPCGGRYIYVHDLPSRFNETC